MIHESHSHELAQLRRQYAELKAAFEKNIIEQKHSEEALQQSEHKFFVLFQKSFFPASLSKLPEGTIVDVNEAFEREFGFTKLEAVGKTTFELGINPDAEGRKRILKVLNESNSVRNQEIVLRSKSGEKCYYETNIDKLVINGEEYLFNTAQNISEYKRAENKLKESYNLIRIAGEKAKLGGWNVILKENRSYWSDEVAVIHGLPAGYSPLVEEGINFYAPEWRAKITEVFSRCAREGIPYDEEMEIITATEKRVWVRTMGEAVHDVNGNIVKVQGALQDITTRKQAEKELKNSEARYKAIFESTGTATLIVDEDTTILRANNECLNITGYDSVELSGQKWTSYVAPESLQEMLKNHQLRRENPKQALRKYEVKLLNKNGEKRDVILNINMIPETKQSVVSMLDITEHKQAEEELVKFKLCIERSSEAIFITDAEGYIIFVNPAFEQLYGYACDDCMGKTPRILKSGTYNEEIYKDFWSSLLSKNVVSGEIVNKTKKGSLLTMDVYNTSILDPKGKIYGFIGIHRDITERKKTEEELKKSEEKYRLLFANNPQPMWIYDLETLAFLEVNRAALNHYGYSKEEFLTMTLKDIRPSEDIPALLEDIRNTRLEYNLAGEWRHLKKNGEIISVEITSHSIIFNDRNARHILIKDVTERKKAEQEIIYQSQMQKILRKIASDFINLPLTKVDEVIKESLGEIGKFVKADRVYVFDYDWNNNICNNTYEWCSPGVQPQIAELQGVPLDAVPHWVNTHKQGKVMYIPDVFALPENNVVRKILEPQEIKSLITIPIMDGQECIGFLGFDSVRGHHIYTEVEEGVLAVLAQMFINISHRKHADVERQKLQHAIEQSPASIIITDLEGNIEYVNPKTLAITAYTKEELIGKNPRIFNSGEKPQEEYKQLWSTILSGKEWFGEFHNKKKNGELYWESASISPILNEKQEIINYVAIKEDITERKKMENIQKVLVNISDAIVSSPNLKTFSEIIFNELTTIINTKNFYIALYNEQKKVFSTVFIFDKQDECLTEFPSSKTLSEYVVRKRKSQFIDKKLFKKLQRQGEIELVGLPSAVWIGVPIFDNEEAIGVMVIQNYEGEKDLTEEDLKILEYAAPAISLAIERKKAIEDLIVAKEKAEESDRLKSAFLANMSHEIRTPMNGILGFTELLLEPDLSSEQKENYIEIVHKSGQRMLNTVTDIIEFSKIEAGAVQLNLAIMDVNGKMEELFRFFQPEADKKGIKLSFEMPLPETDKNISTDQNKLNSILSNIIKNAIKFTDSGTINIGCRTIGAVVEFYVKDTGIGIPEDRQEAIFERFIQADVSDSRAFEGSGLGLAISKSYVEILGGKIWVESREGIGSTFYFTLPVKNSNEKKSIIRDEISYDYKKAKTIVKGLKILIAEDDEPSRNYISLIVKGFCKEILVAGTGIEAIELCRNTKDLDLILMDIKMPGLDGYKATRRIREFNKEVIIIAQTAYGLSGDREKAIESGCNDFIVKPVNKNELQAMIQKYFGK